MRIQVSLVLALGCLAASAGCVGQGFHLLPAAIVAGEYSGELRDSSSTAVGDIGFRLRESGQFSGYGMLLGREISVRGVVNTQGHLTGFVTDDLTQRTGHFDGRFVGAGFAGNWQTDEANGVDMTGSWLVDLVP